MAEEDDILVYFNPGCSKCRGARDLLDERGVDASYYRYLDERPSRGELERVMGMLGIDDPRQMMRTGESVYNELGPRAGTGPDHRDPAARRQAVEVGGHVGRADELEDHVERCAGGEAVRLDHLGGAQLADGRPRLAPAHGGRHVAAGRRRQLHRRGADAAGGAVDADALAETEPALCEESVMGGDERLREAAGLRPRQALRHADHM